MGIWHLIQIFAGLIGIGFLAVVLCGAWSAWLLRDWE